MQISVVIPFLNEVESLPELYDWIKRVMEKHQYSYEVIFIDDGSNDGSWQWVEQLAIHNESVKAIKFRRNYGKSAALNVGFEHTSGRVVITMDADLQDSPDEIPELYQMITEGGYDIVSGWKKKRYDPLSKTIPTKLYNGVTRWMTGLKLHDMNCGLKAYRSDVVKSIEVYGEMHRYIPVIAKWAGFHKIGEKVVQHKARKYGVTKFGISRFLYGFLDLFSIMFMGKFGKRPMHFFGGLGTLTTFLGVMILLYLSIEKLFFAATGLANRPLFFLGILLIIVGFQLFITGFIAELVTRNASDRNQYKIEKYI
ncbi:MAG: glycosyltransferase family 2 protein [Saprospiraceae bacterium]|nr:glycosyltransferase family 2 protein [Saprospiraceae bacterium]MBK7787830.1 glycosyltransferase family 2 protein [Saprospiraceae bacterium]MBK8109107.1 glycosyltransferase family 2 protein [Saprospiraceae bacterium]MBK8849997.1 glycosyltransferase family 2 protein [Saprospiraceae bacterium]MBK9686866.1 glycosyltransferase family 2 protein [Saprospiraceae bacterium]